MKKEELEIVKDIKDILSTFKEEKRAMFKYCLESYVHSLIIFGINSKIAKECIEIWNSFMNVLNDEINIYNFLIRNSDKINYDECCLFVDKIEELSEDTILYFYSMLDDIEDACDTKQDFRARHSKKKFLYINESDEFKNEAIGLVLNFDDIKNYFNYEEDFWKFIENKLRRVNNDNMNYETIMHFDKDNCLDDMRIIVPSVINLFTACVNIHELKHAHDLYSLLGKEVNNEEEFEERAKNEEYIFIKKYVNNKKI